MHASWRFKNFTVTLINTQVYEPPKFLLLFLVNAFLNLPPHLSIYKRRPSAPKAFQVLAENVRMSSTRQASRKSSIQPSVKSIAGLFIPHHLYHPSTTLPCQAQFFCQYYLHACEKIYASSSNPSSPQLHSRPPPQ